MTSELPFSKRYTIQSHIGQGGMGEVSSAIDHVLDREVALKLIHPQMSANPNMRRSFAREARAFALLHHPHIVEIYDYGMTESAQIYIAMEFIHGCTLHALMSEQLPHAMVLEIMKQLLSALAHAHAKGLSHLDLKAENVLISLDQGTLWTKLVDFGIAALPANFDDRDLQTQAPTFGTPAYMAPEQIINNHNLIGPSADIYSAGILLYELLSGALPYNSEPPAELLREQVNAPIPDILWQNRQDVTDDTVRAMYAEIVRTALAKKPWERFVSADAFLQAIMDIPCSEEIAFTPAILDLIQSAVPSQVEPQTPPTPTQKAIGAKIREVETADDSGLFWPSAPLSSIIGAIDDSPDALSESLDAISIPMRDDANQPLPDHERVKEYDIMAETAQKVASQGLVIQCLSGGFGIGKTRLCKLFCQQFLTGQFFTILTPALQYHPISRKKYTPDEISGNVCLSILRQLITYLSENDIPTEDPETEERLLQILEQSADSPNYTPPPWNDIIETILMLLKALPTPCALILDDLQRCGLPIYHLLSRIADTLTAAPIYILLTYDAKELAVTPENAALGKLPCFKRIFEHTITLEPLSDPQMEAMLKTYWQIEPALSDRIIGRSFGNPFYATALIQHLGQTARLIKREDGHFGLDESDTQSLGVPYIVSQFLHQRLDEILLSMGTVADLYREILIRLAAFGHHMFLQELEAFWKFDEDQALASRWRDAIKAWCAAGMLVYAHSEDQAADTLEFSTPWHADVIQAVLPKSRLRSLKSQVALALIDCYTEPTYEQCYRIALFWRGARDAVSYIQCCQQSADQAFEKGALVFALDRYDELIEVFDEMLAMSAPAPSVLHAIEWPQCLISAADITLRLNKFKEFEAHTARLKAWIDKYTEPVYLAYYQLLNAKKSLRNDNYSHAAELAELARDSFAICHDTRHVIQSQIVLADASTRMGNITAAQKHLNTALETLQAGDSSDELAAIQIRLARLELFAGNITRAGTLANAACIRFKNAGLTLDLADADLSRKMIAFLTAPNRDALAALQKSIDTLTQQGDKFATAKAQTCLLVANALADEWETVEHQCQMLLSDNAELPPAIVSGTITLMQALLAAVHGDRFNAINELTMAIACYGPKHRRARAWCHTLSGLNDMMSRNYKHGTQALDRALNDFQALEDQFGVTCVRIAYCALDAICGNSQTIHDRYHRASSALQERDLPIQRALLNALAAFLAKSSSAPERFPMLPDEKPVALPAFFTHTGLQMIQAALHPAPPKAEAQNQNIAQEHDTPSYTSSELDI